MKTKPIITKHGSRNRKMDIRDHCLKQCRNYDGSKVRDCQKRSCLLRPYRMGILSNGSLEEVESAINDYNTKILSKTV